MTSPYYFCRLFGTFYFNRLWHPHLDWRVACLKSWQQLRKRKAGHLKKHNKHNWVVFVAYFTVKYLSRLAKGQIISKANCQVMNSSKKTNQWIWLTTMRRVFVGFFGRNWRHWKDISKLTDLHSDMYNLCNNRRTVL